MESEQKLKARGKVAVMACKWLDARNAKAGLSGKALDAAKARQKGAEHELAEATEKYQKEN